MIDDFAEFIIDGLRKQHARTMAVVLKRIEECAFFSNLDVYSVVVESVESISFDDCCGPKYDEIMNQTEESS